MVTEPTANETQSQSALRPQQSRCLAALAFADPGLTVRHVADVARCSPHDASRRLAELRRVGLAEAAGPLDGITPRLWRLTPPGFALLRLFISQSDLRHKAICATQLGMA